MGLDDIMAGTEQLDLLGGGVGECVFCGIVQGRLKSHVVFEDDKTVAFLDDKPLFLGHCLLIPKEHHQLIQQLPQSLITPLFSNLQLIAEAVKLGMKADGAFIAVNNGVSQRVPHLHVHIVPRRHGDGLRGFFWPRVKYADEKEAEEVRESIRSAIEKLRTR